jgi:hypothetical protein
MVSTNKQQQRQKESLFIYKLAKVNKTQTHANYFAFLLLFLTVNLLAQAKPTIYLVRHAEKITSNPKTTILAN